MFCPDCGTENLKSQKFCTRCGTNLIVIDRAREILDEVTSGGASNQVDGTTILKIVALVSIFGFLFVTGGAIALAGIIVGSHATDFIPASVVLAVAGYASIILICLRLLKLIGTVQKGESKRSAPAYPAPPAMPGSTNRALGEGAPGYHSVTEQTTKQFEAQHRTKS